MFEVESRFQYAVEKRLEGKGQQQTCDECEQGYDEGLQQELADDSRTASAEQAANGRFLAPETGLCDSHIDIIEHGDNEDEQDDTRQHFHFGHIVRAILQIGFHDPAIEVAIRQRDEVYFFMETLMI